MSLIKLGLFGKTEVPNKEKQKIVMFQNRELINALTAEEADILSTTPSAVIESCVLEKLLPNDENLMKLFASYYDNRITMSNLLILIFQGMANNTPIYGRSECNRELVEYIRSLFIWDYPRFNTKYIQGKYDASYFLGAMKGVISYLQYRSKEYIEGVAIATGEAVEKIAADVNRDMFLILPFEMIYKFVAEDINNLNIWECLDLLLFHWPHICHLPHTYKMLMEFVKMQPEEDLKGSASEMYQLRKIMRRLCEGWEKDSDAMDSFTGIRNLKNSSVHPNN